MAFLSARETVKTFCSTAVLISFCILQSATELSRMQGALISENQPKKWNFDEKLPPYSDKTSIWLSVKIQWVLIWTGTVALVTWAIMYGLGMDNLFVSYGPQLLYLLCAMPVVVGFLSQWPPMAVTAFFLFCAAPPLFYMWSVKYLVVYLIGYAISLPLSYNFFFINSAGLGSAPDFLMWGELFTIPLFIGVVNALLFALFTANNYDQRIRWLLLSVAKFGDPMYSAPVAALKVGLKPAPFDPNESRTYAINDVQYIRLKGIRVMMLAFMFWNAKILEDWIMPHITE